MAKVIEKSEYIPLKDQLKIEVQDSETGYWSEVAVVGNKAERTVTTTVVNLFWCFPIECWESEKLRPLTTKSSQELRREAVAIARKYYPTATRTYIENGKVRSTPCGGSVRVRAWHRYREFGELLEEGYWKTIWKDGRWLT